MGFPVSKCLAAAWGWGRMRWEGGSGWGAWRGLSGNDLPVLTTGGVPSHPRHLTSCASPSPPNEFSVPSTPTCPLHLVCLYRSFLVQTLRAGHLYPFITSMDALPFLLVCVSVYLTTQASHHVSLLSHRHNRCMSHLARGFLRVPAQEVGGKFMYLASSAWVVVLSVCHLRLA